MVVTGKRRISIIILTKAICENNIPTESQSTRPWVRRSQFAEARR
jgi:hypothetical protein